MLDQEAYRREYYQRKRAEEPTLRRGMYAIYGWPDVDPMLKLGFAVFWMLVKDANEGRENKKVAKDFALEFGLPTRVINP